MFRRTLIAILSLACISLTSCTWLSDFRDRQQPKVNEPTPALVKREIPKEENVKVANYPINEKL